VSKSPQAMLEDAIVRPLTQPTLPGTPEPEKPGPLVNVGELILVLNDYALPSWQGFYAGGHWTERTQKVADALVAVKAALAEWAITNGGAFPHFSARVDVTIVCYRYRTPTDSDNVCDKLVIDALKHTGVLDEDDTEHVRYCKTLGAKSQRKEDWVWVQIKGVQ
jgi:hypothetical protein